MGEIDSTYFMSDTERFLNRVVSVRRDSSFVVNYWRQVSTFFTSYSKALFA
jgi:hypothetical protein